MCHDIFKQFFEERRADVNNTTTRMTLITPTYVINNTIIRADFMIWGVCCLLASFFGALLASRAGTTTPSGHGT
jgi:hypothetical protein